MADPDLFLFVSHVREDRAAAYEIVEELERRGVPCWIAPRDVRPGRPFDDEIAEAIENSRALLLIFSDQCNEHDYIRREVTVAGESHKVIIPFRVEDAQPRRGLRVRLSDLHWIDGFVSRERALDQVVRTIIPERIRQQEEERRRDGEEERQRRQEETRQEGEEQHRRRQEAAEPPAEREKQGADTARRALELLPGQLPWHLKRRSQLLLSFIGIVMALLAALPYFELRSHATADDRVALPAVILGSLAIALLTLLCIRSERENRGVLYVPVGLNMLVSLFFFAVTFGNIVSPYVRIDSNRGAVIGVCALLALASAVETTAAILKIRGRRSPDWKEVRAKPEQGRS